MRICVSSSTCLSRTYVSLYKLMTYCFPGLGRNSLTVVIYAWSFTEQPSQLKAFTMCALSQSFNSNTFFRVGKGLEIIRNAASFSYLLAAP